MSDVFDRLFQAYQDIESDSEIFETLRETYDGGVFRIFVRHGSRMVFSDDIGVWGRRMEQQGI